MIAASPICWTQVDWVLIIRRWRPWSRTDLFHVGRPVNGERVRAPHDLKELAIRSPRQAVRNTSRIRQAHFYGIRRRSLRLFRAWILQAVAARGHIPKIPADKVAPESVVMEHRREMRIQVDLLLSAA